MSLFSIDVLCTKCFYQTDIIVEREIGTNWETVYTCDDCGEETAKRTMSAPMVFRAAYHDGYKRGGDYQILKEAAKLEKQAANSHGQSKKELMKAIGEVKRAGKAAKGKTD